MEVGIARSIDETFLMNTKDIAIIKSELMFKKRDCPYKGDQNPKKV